MSRNLRLLLLLCSIGGSSASFGQSFTRDELKEARTGGVSYINQAKREDSNMAKTVYEDFKRTNETCHAQSVAAADSCGECVTSNCRSRLKYGCEPKFPTTKPTCADLKSNAKYACLYYAKESSCPSCSNRRSNECESCVRNLCIRRAVEVCPKKPFTEPSCYELRTNSSYHCMYYSSSCTSCSTSSQCTQCVADKCSEIYEKKCPIFRPWSAPKCGDIIDNVAYSCRYYMDSRHCPSCRNLTRSKECKSCADDKCNQRVEENCSWWQKTFHHQALKDISSKTDDCPMKVIFEELAVVVIEELFPMGTIGWLLLEGAELVMSGDGLIQAIVRLIHMKPSEIPHAVAEGFKCFVASLQPANLLKDAIEVVEVAEWAYHKIVQAVNVVVVFFEDVFHIRRRRDLSRQIENNAEPSCQDITDNANQACSYYKTRCQGCDFDPERDCYGWSGELDKLYEAFSKHYWVATAQSNRYDVLEVTYRTDSYGNVESLDARVQLFGKEYTFTIDEYIDIYYKTHVGDTIARKAVELARQQGLQYIHDDRVHPTTHIYSRHNDDSWYGK